MFNSGRFSGISTGHASSGAPPSGQRGRDIFPEGAAPHDVRVREGVDAGVIEEEVVALVGAETGDRRVLPDDSDDAGGAPALPAGVLGQLPEPACSDRGGGCPFSHHDPFMGIAHPSSGRAARR
ncbi:MAG: hypothetical protein GY820_40950 [Gammaproteobacteria bacterium]|nr:hypothetical protein [Gammaproteobacteria bacterium]